MCAAMRECLFSVLCRTQRIENISSSSSSYIVLVPLLTTMTIFPLHLVLVASYWWNYHSNREMAVVFINIAKNGFTHMKTYDNIAIFSFFGVFTGYVFGASFFFLYTAFFSLHGYHVFIFPSFSMPFSPHDSSYLCFICDNNVCMSYYFEDIVNGRVSNLFWTTLYSVVWSSLVYQNITETIDVPPLPPPLDPCICWMICKTCGHWHWSWFAQYMSRWQSKSCE